MKKLKYILLGITMILPMLFTSCTKTVYIDNSTNEVIERLNKEDFIKLEKITNGIYIDRYTGVLYHVYIDVSAYDLVPIMEADGTCLTFQEWEERRKQ